MSILQGLEEAYLDTPAAHTAMWEHCLAQMEATPWLKEHRDFVEAGGYGYGERQFHWLWSALVEAMPPQGKFLEIGVFQGQILSLVALAAKQHKKQVECIGVSPLDSTGEIGHQHPDMDYIQCIKEMHLSFDLPYPKILRGLSFDPRIQEVAKNDFAPIDLLLIDGCHDKAVVVDDIRTYSQLVRTGGYLVMDDACNDLQIPDGMINQNWKGMPGVTEAVKETMLMDTLRWEQTLAVGHQRVFRRLA